MAYRNGEGDMVKWARGKIADAEAVAQDELRRTMQEGAELAIGFIATRGTEKSGKAGRIDTRNMISKVKHRVDKLRDGRARGFFGWLDAWNDSDDAYFTLQEGGFRHWISGEMIPGMYAIADAAEQAFLDLQARLPGAVKSTPSRGFTRRMNMMK